MDRDKVIKALEYCITGDCGSCFYRQQCIKTGIKRDALAMLKEQEDMGKELTDAVELVHKKNKQIEKLLKEQETANLYKCPNCGTWVSAENVVRCKDCKHLEHLIGCKKWHDVCTGGDDWFCADGERRTDDA